ncbi:FMRFamide receptor [Mizuhopecten yessoensis]|uniref:FMRFamide receptor n=1 Tax=Mizuhopecten yessoensis TaxID=6573 RepID=A0A210PL22_MIZYE|nr:FMRFamide receptor [Mizuhopecten yessoensis]
MLYFSDINYDDSAGIADSFESMDDYSIGVIWRDPKSHVRFPNISDALPFVDLYEELSDNEFDTYVLHPWGWREVKEGVPVFVYLLPVLAFITLLVNSLVVFVFFKEKIMSTTNVLLIAVAVSDTLCILPQALFLVSLYAFLRSSEDPPHLPFSLCRVWDYIIKNTTSVTHTASIWLTVCLAAHRYVCVCRPFAAKRYFTRKKTILTIVTIYITSLALHLCRFIDTEYHLVPVGAFKSVNISLAEEELKNSNHTVFTCTAMHVKWLRGNEILYECIYYWIYIAIVIIGPCLSISVLSALMMRGLRRSDAQNMQYVSERQEHRGVIEKLRHKNRIRLTKLIVCIVSIVTLVELPLGVMLILWTVTMLHGTIHISEKTLGNISVLLNLVVYHSYPMIFILYCLMSTRFKTALRNLFRCTKINNQLTSETSVEMNAINGEDHSRTIAK